MLLFSPRSSSRSVCDAVFDPWQLLLCLQETEDKTSQTFRKNIAELEKNNSKEYEKDLEALLRKLGAKNQEKLADVLERQQEEKEAMEEKVSNRTKEVSAAGKRQKDITVFEWPLSESDAVRRQK